VALTLEEGKREIDKALVFGKLLNMSIKEQALQTIKDLPETTDWEEIKERINFVSAIRKGLDELDSGKGIPVEEIENELKAWITK